MNKNARILIFDVPDQHYIPVFGISGEHYPNSCLATRKRSAETGCYFLREADEYFNT